MANRYYSCYTEDCDNATVCPCMNFLGMGFPDMRPATKEERDSVHNYVKSISKPVSSVVSREEHFKLDNKGFMRCTVTGKDIRYPLVSFGDLDYCPRCGIKLGGE